MCNQTLVRKRIEECYVIAEQAFGREFPRPTVRFTKRGTVGATCTNSISGCELNFNMVLLNENVEQYVKQTVAHEVAHDISWVVYQGAFVKFDRYGRKKKIAAHGKEWKSVMRVLGVPAERCHDYDVSSVRQQRKPQEKFNYHCSHCDKIVPMGKIRHNRHQSGKATYSHCRGYTIKFIG